MYATEIAPSKHRSRIAGFGNMANGIGGYLVQRFTLPLFNALGLGLFFIVAVFNLVAFFFAAWLPETQGVPLEKIGELFDHKFRVPKASEGPDDVV